MGGNLTSKSLRYYFSRNEYPRLIIALRVIFSRMVFYSWHSPNPSCITTSAYNMDSNTKKDHYSHSTTWSRRIRYLTLGCSLVSDQTYSNSTHSVMNMQNGGGIAKSKWLLSSLQPDVTHLMPSSNWLHNDWGGSSWCRKHCIMCCCLSALPETRETLPPPQRPACTRQRSKIVVVYQNNRSFKYLSC